MSNLSRLVDTMVIGSTHKYNKQKKGGVVLKDIDEVYDKHRCVIHLIDLSPLYEEEEIELDPVVIMDLEEYIGMKREEKVEGVESQAEFCRRIEDFITDQHIELWNMMKRGDILEDISRYTDIDKSICKNKDVDDRYIPTKGRYIIDSIDRYEKDVHKGVHLVRNGLTVRELYNENASEMHSENPKNRLMYKMRSTVRPDMYTITEFPIGYFDIFVVNDMLAPGSRHNTSWGTDRCLIALDVEKLGLNNLKTKDVIETTVTNDQNITIDYLYTIVNHKFVDYMIISEYSRLVSAYNMKKETKRFIDMFKKNQMYESYIRSKDHNIMQIANAANIKIENVLCI